MAAGTLRDAGVRLSPAFVLLGAGLYFAGGSGAVAALAASMLAHELGHLAALYAAGGKVRAIRLAPGGPVIEYDGARSETAKRAVLASGPAAGLLFAVSCLLVPTEFFTYTGAVSLLTTAFNLLPALPLDGGRLTESMLAGFLPERTLRLVMGVLGNLSALGVAATGISLRSAAAAAAGVWLAVLVNLPKMR